MFFDKSRTPNQNFKAYDNLNNKSLGICMNIKKMERIDSFNLPMKWLCDEKSDIRNV